MSDDFEIELKNDFLEEFTDLLDAAEEAFLSLEDNKENAEIINEIFRLAHNLKGTANAVGFDQLAELTHIAENLILKIKSGDVIINDSIVSILLEFKDQVCALIEGLKEDHSFKGEISSIISSLEKCCMQDSSSAEVLTSSSLEEAVPHADAFGDELEEEDLPQKQEVLVDDTPERVLESQDSTDDSFGYSVAALESLKEAGFDNAEEMLAAARDEEDKDKEKEKEVSNDTQVEDSKFEEIGKDDSVLKFNNLENVETEQNQNKTQEAARDEAQPLEKKNPSSSSSKKKEVDETIRVKLSRIDSLNNVLGELVILQTLLSQRRFQYIEDELSNKSIGMMNKLFKEVQGISMSLRMLPLKSTFQKMSRIVRDTSKLLGKEVELVIIGEETEVDKTVLEKLADPLVHIIRNAVDHGLELPVDREGSGKEAKGRVTLSAFHEGNSLVIEVVDDGKGIDPEVLLKKAQEKGIVGNRKLDQQEILNLIFHPGFSTKAEVTEVSGRGVGMDVVKTNIEQLGGEVNLTSKLGKGSTFKIILPLTLAIIDGMVISSGEEKFVIPLSQVNEITQFDVKEIQYFSGVTPMIKLRGEVLPLFFLEEKVNGTKNSLERVTVIVVRNQNLSFGVALEDIHQQQQIVVKKLGQDIKNQKGLMGSAIMSDGRPSLILDIIEMFKDDFKSSAGSLDQGRQRTA
jgi:two-component system chemotaxis sensor kinase CheA